jgi:hypothetical protein
LRSLRKEESGHFLGKLRLSPTKLINFILKGWLQYPIGTKNAGQNQSSPIGDRKNGVGGDGGGRAAGRRPRAELVMGWRHGAAARVSSGHAEASGGARSGAAAPGGANGGLRRSLQRSSSSGHAAARRRPRAELAAAAWWSSDGGSLSKKLSGSTVGSFADQPYRRLFCRSTVGSITCNREHDRAN